VDEVVVPQWWNRALPLTRPDAVMRPHRPVPKPGNLSGFYGSLECLKSISDIQRQTGKPISMPTANVAIK
jgi:hypothetical protein